MKSQIPRISVISPSIRPRGLEVTFNTLQEQDFKDFEWLPRLSIPGEKSDLCYQMNKALEEAKGDIVVFLQDWIEIEPNALRRISALFDGKKDIAWTFPVSKIDEQEDIPRDDWRIHGKIREVTYAEWEIDFGAIHRDVIGGYKFTEKYDEGFGWENVDLAYRLKKLNKDLKFKVEPHIKAIAWDHDKHVKHPYKHNPNSDLWTKMKAVYDIM